MTKYSDDSKEIGASSVPNIVIPYMFLLKMTTTLYAPFSTRQEQLQKTIAAQRGTQIEDNRHLRAKTRGHYMEPACLEFGADTIQTIAGDMNVSWSIPDDADRYPELKIAASCDAHITVDGKINIQHPDGRVISVSGDGVMEAKTDASSDGEPRLDQIIQLNTQMACSGRTWGIIVKYGKSHFFSVWPYHFDPELWDITKDAITEFWHKVENDIPYDPIEKPKPEIIDLEGHGSNHDLLTLCDNFLKHKENSKIEDELAKDIADGLGQYLESVGAEIGKIGPYTIKWQERIRKATPEKTVPAKSETKYKVFKLEKDYE
jgi:hypothetical protein